MQKGQIEFTILGCGSSGGVPRINGDWGECDPSNPKNRRTRCSAYVRYWSEGSTDATTVLIDTSPDLREQLLRARITELDALLYTHDHADQSHGIDDIRILAYSKKSQIPVYMDGATTKTLTKRFGYCFEGANGYPPILDIKAEVKPYQTFSVNGPGGKFDIEPLDQDHGFIRSLGFRFGSIAYCNDVVSLPATTIERLLDLDVLVVDCLRRSPHPTHAHLSKTLEWIETIKPIKAVLTNLHIDLDYDVLVRELPPYVIPAYDGMVLNSKCT